MRRYKSTAATKPKKSRVLIFLDVVIGILAALILFALIGFFAGSRDDYYNRKFGDRLTSRDIEEGEYADLLEQYYSDRGILGLVNEGYEDCAAVARYAEAAVRESAYRLDGDDERADRQKAIMEDAVKETGIYSPETAKIDGLLDGSK